MIWLRYALLMTIFPCYFIALSRRWWTTIPLWLVSTFAMLAQYWMAVHQGAAFASGSTESSILYVGEMTKIMLIPAAVQIAVQLKAWQSRVGNRVAIAPKGLIANLNAGSH